VATVVLIGALALPAGAAASAPSFRTLDLAGGRKVLEAEAPVARVCSDRVLGPSAAGVVQQRLTPGAAGLLDARLLGSPYGDDWDLAVFDRASGELLAGSAAFGGNEVASAPVRPGQELVVQACRVSGTGDAVPMTVTEAVADGPLPRAEKQSLVSIAVAGQEDVDRLQAAGIDLNETGEKGTIAAVLHSAADRATVRDLGLRVTTDIDDLAAHDRATARRGATAARRRSALPSARSDYRRLVDYENDLKALVTAHPGVVRPVVLPHLSVQGRTIQGVEIATDVDRTDDGRPTVYQLGLHHVREWPSGEVSMEHAADLLTPRDAADGARKQRLLDGVRTFVLPVINPDGLVATQLAGGYGPIDDDADATLALSAAGQGAYRRKNCGDGLATPLPTTPTTPCALLPGVDLNRNYGAFWGGPGSSDQVSNQTYRGAAPFSEPEVRAFHDWSSTHVVNVVNSNHTFGGDLLYQPGFNAADEPGLPAKTKVPFQDDMKALSDAAAAAAGYQSFVSYNLYDVTGATEDWNYFATGAFGYTTEVSYDNFHPNYQDGVIDQFLGTVDGTASAASGRKPSKGLRESMLLEGEAALNPRYHAEITGTAPAGRTLRLRKTFTTSTSFVETTVGGVGAAQEIPEQLDFSRTVPSSGSYSWAVGPSTRPVVLLAGGTESYTMTCEDAAGKVYETRQVAVGIGESKTEDFTACADPEPTTPDPATPTTTTPATPTTSTPATPTPTTTAPATPATPAAPGAGGASGPGTAASLASRLRIVRPAFSARRVRRTGTVGVRLRLTAGSTLRRVTVRIVDRRGRTLLRGTTATLSGARTVRLRRAAARSRIRPGTARVIVRGTLAGKAATATRAVRIAR
jgi:hypothetical protein